MQVFSIRGFKMPLLHTWYKTITYLVYDDPRYNDLAYTDPRHDGSRHTSDGTRAAKNDYKYKFLGRQKYQKHSQKMLHK